MENRAINIEEFANNIRKLAENELGKPDNISSFLYSFVNKIGGIIEPVKDPSCYEENGGSLTINEDGSFVIKLPPYTSPLRDNFTIAHELGHYFIHYLPNKEQRVFYRYGSGPMEIIANKFAAAFLMPKEEFIKKEKEFNASLLKLSAYFEVSTTSVQYRMVNLHHE
ncbi:MAG: ImmA/IrrE family metallo-endopeptidase [Treponema sp.]|nr:ImmA/IrrE family metallo-endopeptidase [Treponema sp.]